MNILKNQSGGIGIMLAIIPGIVIFGSFFMINSVVKRGADLTKRDLEINKVDKVMTELAQQLYTGFVEGNSPIVAGGGCAAINKLNMPAPPAHTNGLPASTLCVTNRPAPYLCVTDPTNPAQEYCMDNLNALNKPDENGYYTVEFYHSKPVPFSKRMDASINSFLKVSGDKIASFTSKVVPTPVARFLEADILSQAHAQGFISTIPPQPEAADTTTTANIPDCSIPTDPLDNGNCFSCNDPNTFCYQIGVCPPDQVCGNGGDLHWQTVVFRR